MTGKATAPGEWHPSQLGDLLKGGEEAKKDVQLIDVREPDELLRADIKGEEEEEEGGREGGDWEVLGGIQNCRAVFA